VLHSSDSFFSAILDLIRTHSLSIIYIVISIDHSIDPSLLANSLNLQEDLEYQVIRSFPKDKCGSV